MAAYAAPVNGTDDPELYETERWGNFSYAIPVSPGKYYRHAVLCGAPRQSGTSPHLPTATQAAVAHIFNVFCNGNTLLKNFNLA